MGHDVLHRFAGEEHREFLPPIPERPPAAGGAGVFSASAADEAGTVPGAGTGSTFEQGVLDFVYEDGWFDFGNANEGDDFASVWQFTQPYRYIAVYSNFTDPFVGDGFRSFDNELDAIGRFLKDVGEPPPSVPEPSTLLLLGSGLAGLAGWRWRKNRVVTS